jgi:hypothetical protein
VHISVGEQVGVGGKVKWLAATIESFNEITEQYQIKYECDGDVEQLDLLRAERDWQLLALP